MSGLPENPNWEAEIYQIEQTDPVLGGPPDLPQGKGITNVPAQQLANRTAWLKAQIEALAGSSASQVDLDALSAQLTAHIAGVVTQADIDASAAALQTNIDTVEGHVPSIIRNEMHFSCTVDPDEANPTEYEGGVFNSLKAAIEAAPAGSYAQILLLAGKTYPIDEDIVMHHQAVFLWRTGSGANPILAPAAYASATHNSLYCVVQQGMSKLRMKDIDIAFPALADAGLPTSAADTLLRYSSGNETSLGMIGGTVTGSDGWGLTCGLAGTRALLDLYQTTLDGNIVGLKRAHASNPVPIDSGVTLLNGATL